MLTHEIGSKNCRIKIFYLYTSLPITNYLYPEIPGFASKFRNSKKNSAAPHPAAPGLNMLSKLFFRRRNLNFWGLLWRKTMKQCGYFDKELKTSKVNFTYRKFLIFRIKFRAFWMRFVKYYDVEVWLIWEIKIPELFLWTSNEKNDNLSY